MTWEGYWVPNLVQWFLGSLVSVLVGLYVRRLVRMNREQVERVVDAVEGVLGGVRVPTTGAIATAVPSARPARKERIVDIPRYRKAIGAGVGVLLIGVLTWASTSTELRVMLEAIVPAPFVPLVGVLLGGIATVVAVVKSTNAPAPSPYRRTELTDHYGSPDTLASEPEVTIPAPGPTAEPQPATLAGLLQVAGPGQASAAAAAPPPEPTSTAAADSASVDEPAYWAGIPRREPAAHTSIVQLADVPATDYR